MENRSINLAGVKRQWDLAPPVTTVAFMNFRYAQYRELHDIQIAYHPSGSPEQAEFSFNGENYVVGYPHILIKRPGILCAKPGSGRSFYFKYSADNAPAIPDDLVASTLPPSPELEAISQRIYSLMEHSLEYGIPDRIDTLCLEFFCTMLALREQSKPASGSAVRAAASWMYAHLADVDIDRTASKFGFSRRNFDRCYRAEFGISPGKSLTEYRMLEAIRLLIETDLSIWEIARNLGYQEAANFIAAFRRAHGITPLQFRNAGRRR